MPKDCKECLHHEACAEYAEMINSGNILESIEKSCHDCKQFHPKNMVIDLPGPIGGHIYEITKCGHIYERYVAGYHCNTVGKQKGEYFIIGTRCGMLDRVKFNKLGKSFFFNLEEAEKVRDKEFPDMVGTSVGGYICPKLGF